MHDVLNFVNNLKIDKNNYVIVACSYGPDSMMLVHLLMMNKFKVVVAHVNHKFRTESDKEYVDLKEYCENNNIIFEGAELTTYNSGNFENFAREFRYNFFEEVMKKYNTDILFTAHHGDDLTETILMRLTRGSSIKGYGGFEKVTKRSWYKIIRPLVYITKKEIMEYLEKNNIPYALDYTNDDLDYTRNRFRHVILPKLHDEEENVHLKFLDFSEQVHDMYHYIDREVSRILNEIFVDNYLDINKFKLLDPFIQKECFYKILRLIYINDLYVIEDSHLDELRKLIESSKPNIILKFPNGLTIIKEYDRLLFTKDVIDNGGYNIELIDHVDLTLGKISIVNESNDTSNFVTRLNSKEIKLPLYVRTRINGDKMNVKNMNGYKKVNDIFVDSKVTKCNRDIYPIVVDSDDNILFIPGLKKSKFDIPINGEYDIIIKYEKERNK